MKKQFNYKKLPEVMLQQPRFVLWGAQEQNGRTNKIPIAFNSNALYAAKSNDSSTWGSFSAAINTLNQSRGKVISVGGKKNVTVCGIGFMLQGSGLFCVDLDHKDIELEEYRAGGAGGIVGEFLNAFKNKAYVEVSQSGSGVHIFAAGKLPQGKRKNDKIGVEMYDSGRFIALTGDIISTQHERITGDSTQLINQLHKIYFPDGSPHTDAAQKGNVSALTATEEVIKRGATVNLEILQRARTAKNGAAFIALYDNGDISNYNNDDSAADMALCNMLAFWLQGDRTAIDTAFRGSALYRPKWDERRGTDTYGNITIDRAIKDCNGIFFDSAKSKKKKPAAAVPPENWFSGDYILNNNGKLKACDYNYRKYLQESTLTDNIYLDLFSEQLRIIEMSGTERLVSDDDLLQIENQMLNSIFSGCNIGIDKIHSAIRSTCKRRHTVQEYFQTLRWDGTPRVERLLIDLLGAPDDIYVCESTKLFLLGIISRVFNPGTKFDYMLILQGGQGIGKTSFFQKLAIHPEWYAEIGAAHMQDKKLLGEDSVGKLILEYGELDGIRKTAAGRLKATITRTDDNYRASYGRLSLDHPRKFVIAGTTNTSTYLSDPTGNRRFLPIPVTRKGFLTPDTVGQVWAEAYNIYRQGNFKLYLSAEVESIAETYRDNSTMLASDDYIEPIQQLLESRSANGSLIYPDKVTATEIYKALAETTFLKMRQSEALPIIRQALELLGWNYKQKKVAGIPIRAYWRT